MSIYVPTTWQDALDYFLSVFSVVVICGSAIIADELWFSILCILILISWHLGRNGR